MALLTHIADGMTASHTNVVAQKARPFDSSQGELGVHAATSSLSPPDSRR